MRPRDGRQIYHHVLVMHDGQNLFDPKTSFLGIAWMVQDTLNRLVGQGLIEEVFVVGVDNTGDRMNELTYSYDPDEKVGGKGDLYLDFVTQTVLPMANRHYGNRLDLDRESLAIGGSSLGGLISCYAAWTRSSVFGAAICMSSSFDWNRRDFDRIVLPSTPTPSLPDVRLYLDSGDVGPDEDDKMQTIEVRDHLIRLGYALQDRLFYFLDHGAQHNEKFWAARFWRPIIDLYGVAR